MTNKYKQVFYIGITGDLKKRVFQHKNKIVDGFTKKYNLDKLVYFEIFENVNEAIAREKQLKNWHREWKLNLIKAVNPALDDIYHKI